MKQENSFMWIVLGLLALVFFGRKSAAAKDAGSSAAKVTVPTPASGANAGQVIADVIQQARDVQDYLAKTFGGFGTDTPKSTPSVSTPANPNAGSSPTQAVTTSDDAIQGARDSQDWASQVFGGWGDSAVNENVTDNVTDNGQ